MGVVNISLSDLKKGLPVDPGIYKAKIIRYEEELAKAGDSQNYLFTFELENDDKNLISARFNSKAMGFTRPFLAAIAGKPEKEWLDETAALMKSKGVEIFPFDGEKCVGKNIGVKVVQNANPTGGTPYTNVDGYLPYTSVF